MGTGEALVTALNEKGLTTPLVHTLVRAPISRMDILTAQEIDQLVQDSALLHKYNDEIDRHSAYEMLSEKIASTEKETIADKKQSKSPGKAGKQEDSFIEQMSKNTMVRQVGRTIFRELTRNIMGTLLGKRRR